MRRLAAFLKSAELITDLYERSEARERFPPETRQHRPQMQRTSYRPSWIAVGFLVRDPSGANIDGLAGIPTKYRFFQGASLTFT